MHIRLVKLLPIRWAPLAAIAVFFTAAPLNAAVEVYVTDFLAPQEKAIKPLGGKVTNTARLFATPGEYEPVSFSVRPDERVEQIFLAAGDLTGPGGTISKANVRVQSVEAFHGGDKDILMDLRAPWDMPAYQRQLFWVTVHVPATAKPGLYQGEVTVTGSGRPLTRLTLEVEVLPFTLDDPPFALGFNYSSPKDPQALAAHLADMRAHGMTTVAPLYNFDLPIHDDRTREFGEFIESLPPRRVHAAAVLRRLDGFDDERPHRLRPRRYPPLSANASSRPCGCSTRKQAGTMSRCCSASPTS